MGNKVDLTNQTFGKLTVVEMLYNYKKEGTKNPKTYCRCQCECGTEKIVLATNLKKGYTRSCGCYEKESRYDRKHYKDLTGLKFGKLTVMNKTKEKTSNGCVKWLCKCECGNFRIVPSSDLIRGRVFHCGCENYKTITLNITGQKFGHLTAIRPVRKDGVNRTAWECVCDCGNRTIVTTDCLTTGNTISCGKCHNVKSYHEQFIENILINQKVNYEYSYRFDDCRAPDTNRKLPFDFYLHDYNLIIEYDGEQHVKAIDAWGGTKGLNRRQFLDRLKTNYCGDNNINLLRIPHTYDFDEIKKSILNILESRNDHSGVSNYTAYATHLN